MRAGRASPRCAGLMRTEPKRAGPARIAIPTFIILNKTFYKYNRYRIFDFSLTLPTSQSCFTFHSVFVSQDFPFFLFSIYFPHWVSSCPSNVRLLLLRSVRVCRLGCGSLFAVRIRWSSFCHHLLHSPFLHHLRSLLHWSWSPMFTFVFCTSIVVTSKHYHYSPIIYWVCCFCYVWCFHFSNFC